MCRVPLNSTCVQFSVGAGAVLRIKYGVEKDQSYSIIASATSEE